jgi:hypothetical protein
MNRALLLLPAAALGALLPAQEAAARAAAGFQRVLWVSAAQGRDAAFLQRTRDVGFDAVELGPDGDRAAVEKAGLGWYLDQPAGKGLLELRDADWEPLRKAYEGSRDPAVLRRPACLQDQDLLAATAARACAAAAAMRGPGLRFVALADEASATRHNNPLDVCRCERCCKAFVGFLRRRSDSLPALNAAWGTEFDDWAAVVPLTTDQVRRRELGGTGLPRNLQPFADWLEFVDSQFATAVGQLRAHVQAEVPGVPTGLTGLQAPAAFGGHDYARLLPGLTLLEPYDVGSACELARSFAPGAEFWCTLTLPSNAQRAQPLLIAQLCAAAARGLAGAVVWNGDAMFADGKATPVGKALLDAFAAVRPALDACAGAEPVPGDVWLVESQASVRAWWMIDSAADGLSWVRRLASYEAAHSTSLAARASWVKLLMDLGQSPRFVADTELPEKLLRERPRLLVLPAAIALADRSCQAIATFVRNGGVVVADHTPALYDEHLQLRARGGLDEVFGVSARSPQFGDLRVREGRRVAAANGGLAAEGGLRGPVGEPSGDAQVFVESCVGRGRAIYLNFAVCDYAAIRLDLGAALAAQDLRRRVRQVLKTAFVEPPFDVRGEALPTCLHRGVLRTRDGRRMLYVRLDALEKPQLLLELQKQPVRKVKLSFGRLAHLVTLAGEDLGRQETFELPLDVCAGLFVLEVGRG